MKQILRATVATVAIAIFAPFSASAKAPTTGPITMKTLEKRAYKELSKAWRLPHTQGGQQAVFWNQKSTPIFPAPETPAGGPAQDYVIYTYAGGLDPRLTDAERTSGLLKEWRWNSKTDQSALSVMTDDVEAIGTQNVRPVKGPSPWSKMGRVPVEALSLTLSGLSKGSEDTVKIRDAYCWWFATNNVIAAQVRVKQAAFVAKLGCR